MQVILQSRYVCCNVCHYRQINLIFWHYQNFLPRLRDHLLARLLGCQHDGDELIYSDFQRSHVLFENNRLYFHKVLRINYTTYDVRRGQDSMNPRTHSDVMVLTQEEENTSTDTHPFWYARVLGVFHANILHVGSPLPKLQRMEFLWVRWFGRDMSVHGGPTTRRLHRVGFVPATDPSAFGFLDPSQVVRGSHLIPAYAHGRTSDLLRGPSLARPEGEPNDWEYYYVNQYVFSIF